jgi:hypothetical protein
VGAAQGAQPAVTGRKHGIADRQAIEDWQQRAVPVGDERLIRRRIEKEEGRAIYRIARPFPFCALRIRSAKDGARTRSPNQKPDRAAFRFAR